MDSTVEPPDAPLPAAFGQVVDGLVQMAGVPLWTAAEADVLAGLDALMEAEARLAGVRARLLTEIESRGLRAGTACTKPAALLRHRYRLDPQAARRLADQAEAVQTVFPAVGQALCDGAVNARQAEAIVAGLAKLPAYTSDADRIGAQRFLIGQAASLEPVQLRKATNRLVEMLTVVSEDGEPPDDTAPDPHQKRSITFHWQNGGLAGRFYIPETDAAEVAAFFAARARPDSEDHGDPTHPAGYDTRRDDQRNYDAVLAAIRHALGCLQDPGPRVPQVVVTIDYEWLLANLTGIPSGAGPTGTTGSGTAGAAATGGEPAGGWAMPPAGSAQAAAAAPDPTVRRPGLPRLLDLDQPISPAEARRLACDALIIPAVLGTAGQVLDLGRGQRLFGATLRRTLALRDGGCAFPGCDKPPIACDGHHLVTPWQELGGTCPENGTLLCPQHHRLVHRQGWTGRLDRNGNPQFIPPDWIDAQQRPREHHRFTLRGYLLKG